MGVYDLVPDILERVRVGASTLSRVVAGLRTQPDNAFALGRIRRDREAATGQYLRDRDVVALQQTMARLDADEVAARASGRVVDSEEALRWLQDLPALWRAGDDSGRRLLTEALFEKIEVLGVRSATIHPTLEADAHGWSDAFGSEPLMAEVVADAISMYGRGERDSPYVTHVRTRPSLTLVNRTRATSGTRLSAARSA